jgi:predicted SAM-dependent methyltransferase
MQPRPFRTGSGLLRREPPVLHGRSTRSLEHNTHRHTRLQRFDVRDIDVLDDGEDLAKFEDDSVDFVIAAHFLEHCENPIGAILAHLRVARPGGKLFYIVPDGRYSFDSKRPVTSLEHVWQDFRDGPRVSPEEHYLDWSKNMTEHVGDALEAWWRACDAINASIHFHVWPPADVTELFLDVRRQLSLSFDVLRFQQLHHECALVLQK